MIRLPALLLALLLCAPQPAGAAERAPAAAGDDLLNGYNRIIFAINRTVYSVLDALTGGDAPAATESDPPPGDAPLDVPAPMPPPTPGPAQMISNLINEPLTLLSSLVVGDFGTAWNAAQRFGINSTVGVLGWYDAARDWGHQPVPADVGLSLCRMGVGEGGYVVLPFIGPRTWRDAVADVVLVNALLWTTTGAILNSGLSLQTIIVAELIEVGADIVATRQIDPRAKAQHYDDYDRMRAQYLAQRRQRCTGESAMQVAGALPVP